MCICPDNYPICFTPHTDPGSNFDCNGQCFGSAEKDDCGVCSGGNSGHVADSDKDECGVCFGDNSICADCFGVPYSEAELDECGVCDSDPNNDPLINSYSMIPSSSDNILGTPLTSFSAEMSVGNVTVEIS